MKEAKVRILSSRRWDEVGGAPVVSAVVGGAAGAAARGGSAARGGVAGTETAGGAVLQVSARIRGDAGGGDGVDDRGAAGGDAGGDSGGNAGGDAKPAAGVGPGVERRAAVRQTIVAKATLYLDPPAKVDGEWPVIEPTLRVYLTNLSMGGVGFRVPRVLEVGRTGRMRIEIGPINFVSRLEVVRATLREDRVMEVGARFVRDEIGTGNTRPAMVNQPIMSGVARNPCRALAPRKRD